MHLGPHDFLVSNDESTVIVLIHPEPFLNYVGPYIQST